jgi:hypothetical protein
MTLDFIKAFALASCGRGRSLLALPIRSTDPCCGRPAIRPALIVALGGPAARGLLDAGLPRGQLCETGLLEFRDR